MKPYKKEEFFDNQMKIYAQDYLKDNLVTVLLPKALDKADNHYKNWEYEDMIDTLKPFEAKLSGVNLKKYQLAMKKIKG